MKSLYIETSIISFLRQRPSAHVVTAARQLLTHRWWYEERHHYQLVASQYVVDEASEGDPTLADERLKLLQGIPLLSLDAEIIAIADEIMKRAILPPKASVDAIHLALASFHQVDYLLTWNCRHIANGRTLPRILGIIQSLGFSTPFVCTPEEMVTDATTE